MPDSLALPKKKISWMNLPFFAVTTAGALIGAPIYIWQCGISLSEVLLFAFFLFASGLSVTVGYHRLFAHATYKANPVLQFLLLFFGAATFQESALKWSSQHRNHHRYVDTDLDPYNIKKGFFYAHLGWLLFWEHSVDFKNAKDLSRNKMIMNQHNHYLWWAIGSGIILPLLLGALTGHLLGAILFTICCRLTIVYQGTFCINSICHMFGKATFDPKATAKDHWLAAILTNGEGYHNFHHRFPTDYRNGVRWYHWDPSKWMIALFSGLGLAWNLRRTPRSAILEAKLAAEKQTDNFYEIIPFYGRQKT